MSKARSIAALGAAVLSGLVPASALAADCDRDCLGGMITQYVDALIAQDPSSLPLAGDVRFTENSQEMELGEGLWETAAADGGFRQDYLDTQKQIAASHVVVLEEGEGNRALLSVLLHLDDGAIAGVETLVQHITPDSQFQPRELGQPIRYMNDPVPEARRQSRESMIRTALTYTEGLRIGDFVEAPTVFADTGYRVENGWITAGQGCGRDDCTMQTQDIIEHPDIWASVAAVDEENGVVLLWMNFGFTDSYGPGNSLVTFEAFKVWGGEIQVVHAFFPILPMETTRGWPSSDPLPAYMAHVAEP
jgi:hypothetical protein